MVLAEPSRARAVPIAPRERPRTEDDILCELDLASDGRGSTPRDRIDLLIRLLLLAIAALWLFRP